MSAKVQTSSAHPPVTADMTESAKLDMIGLNLRASAVQIAISSVVLTILFDRRVTGYGVETDLLQSLWLAGQFIVAAVFLAVAHHWPLKTDSSHGVQRRHAYIALYLVSGAWWGALTWAAIIPGDVLNQVLVMLVLICISVLYVVRLAPHVPVFMAAVCSMFLVAMPNSWILDNGLASVIKFALPAWVLMLYISAGRLSRQIADMIETRQRERELVERLSDAHARAEAESASKSAFLANMSHELRTPLNAIIGFSDVMRSGLFGTLNDRYRSYAEDIHASGEHLLSLINDVLDIAKIEAGQMQVSIEPVNTADIARQVMRLLQPRAAEKRQTLKMSMAAAPAKMLADPRAVTQIILNVAGNAVKYTQAGGLVEIRIEAEGRDVLFTVSDNGPGIPHDKQALLFKPFERLDNTYLAGDAGTGLGLSLVRALAALHGGDASIESALGHGTHVTVRLPGAAMSPGAVRAA